MSSFAPIVYDVANKKHRPLASGETLPASAIPLSAAAGNALAANSDGIYLQIPADHLLSSSSVSANGIITLTMSDGTVYTVNLNDLVSSEVANGASTTGSGAGTTASPIKFDLNLSADAGNAAKFGTDGNLFVPAAQKAAFADGSSTAKKGDGYTTPVSFDLALSGDAGNQAKLGTDGNLFVPVNTFAAGTAPATNEDGSLPTEVYGALSKLLGSPDKWLALPDGSGNTPVYTA